MRISFVRPGSAAAAVTLCADKPYRFVWQPHRGHKALRAWPCKWLGAQSMDTARALCIEYIYFSNIVASSRIIAQVWVARAPQAILQLFPNKMRATTARTRRTGDTLNTRHAQYIIYPMFQTINWTIRLRSRAHNTWNILLLLYGYHIPCRRSVIIQFNDFIIRPNGDLYLLLLVVAFDVRLGCEGYV